VRIVNPFAERCIRYPGINTLRVKVNGEEDALGPDSSDDGPEARQHNPDPLPSIEPERPHGGTLARAVDPCPPVSSLVAALTGIDTHERRPIEDEGPPLGVGFS
jgi:hypothetical protein